MPPSGRHSISIMAQLIFNALYDFFINFAVTDVFRVCVFSSVVCISLFGLFSFVRLKK